MLFIARIAAVGEPEYRLRLRERLADILQVPVNVAQGAELSVVDISGTILRNQVASSRRVERFLAYSASRGKTALYRAIIFDAIIPFSCINLRAVVPQFMTLFMAGRAARSTACPHHHALA